jgi:beta-galactosidase
LKNNTTAHRSLINQLKKPAKAKSDASRRRESFDFDWKFFKGDKPGAEQPDFSDADWRNLDLPHDWSIEGPFREEHGSMTSAHLPTGTGWYRKHFKIPASYRNKKVTIEFDGIYQNSEVWINGQYLRKRPYGYISFYYDISPYLNFSGENLMAVRVDNFHQPNCRWYSGSGIYRHTWLRVTDKLHIAHWGTFVTTDKASEKSATVQIITRVQNEGKNDIMCTLSTIVLECDGSAVQTAETSRNIAAGGEYEFIQKVKITNPSLWSPDNPYLHKVRSTVIKQGKATDIYDTVFGVRSIEFDKDKGFLLNGRQVKLHGVCLHHEAGAVGAAVPERVWERRLEKLKEMGCNAIRTSHNPYSPEFMDLCDRMGFLVMAEIYDEWKEPKPQTPDFGYRIYFDEWSERDVTDFIRRDRNHPSVVIWSAGNEVVDQVVPAGTETLKKLINIFHREDPTRPVTVGCDRIVAEPEAVPQKFLKLLDVVGYNYVDRWRDRYEKYYSIDRQAFPKRKFIGTENGSLGGIRGDYSYLFPQTTGPISRRNNNRWIDFEQMWKFVSTYDYVSGDFMWTGIDYLGESNWPRKANTSGVIDTCGFEKDTWYFCQSQWTDKPMLHIFPHWNWPGKEGEYVPVLCYTNCDSVELFLNGKSLGIQSYWFPRSGMQGEYEDFPARNSIPRTTEDLHLTWTVPYQPGKLKAVGMKNGKEVVTEEISTTGKPAAIRLCADRKIIAADRIDIAHITCKILDAQGRMVPVADNEITFKIQGEGKIIGLDNGNPVSHEDYQANHRKAFNGLCLVIIQSADKNGIIQLSATSPGLKSDSITITTKQFAKGEIK